MLYKLSEVLEIFNELKRIDDVKASARFSYAAMRNYKICEGQSEIIKNIATKPIEGGDVYRKARMTLVEEFVMKDDKGKPKTKLDPSDGLHHYEFETDEKKEDFLKKVKKLDERNKDYLDKLKERQTKLDDMMEEEVDLEFLQVAFNEFPASMTPKQVRILSFMIKEEQDDK